MGGRGARSGAGRMGGGGGISPSDIVSTRDLMSDRGRNQQMVDELMTPFKDANGEYGYVVEQVQLATLKSGTNAIAYYDGANIALNEAYYNKKGLETAYAECVKSGFHPSKGKKTAAEAVMAHEIGHALTDAVGQKMGITGLGQTDRAATRIVSEARKQTKHRGVVQMASKISGYATYSNAEAIAEAFSDVYCNGGKARSESKAIVNVINSYLK